MPRLFLVVLGMILISSSAISGAEYHDYSQYTHWNGSFLTSDDDVTSAGNYEILGRTYLVSTGLLSDLTFYGTTAGSLEELGSLPLPGFAQDVVFSGGFGYVVSQPDRLTKVNAYTPAGFLASMWVDILPGSPSDAEFFEPYLLIACGADGLFVYDPTEIFNHPVGVVGNWSGVAHEVLVEGTTAVVLTDTGITTLDLSNPLIPLELGSYPLFDPMALAVGGNLAYVGQRATPETGGWVAELDFSDPSDIALTRTFTDLGQFSTTALSLVDGMLVAAGHQDLKFIDLESGVVIWDGVGAPNPEAMTFLDGHLGLACGHSGFHTFAVKSPSYPPSTETFGVSETLRNLQIDREFLFGSAGNQVFCFDLEPALPGLAWTYTSPDASEFVVCLQAKDGRVYIGYLSGWVQILEYTRDMFTELVSFHPGGEEIVGLGVLDEALAVHFDPTDDMFIQRELHLYDLTNIDSPLLLDTYSNDDFPNMLAAGSTIALWDGSISAHGIKVLDASNPENLVVASQIATLPLARVTRNGDILNIVATPVLRTVDISNPYSPQQGTATSIPDAYYLAAHGNTGYLVNSDLVFDLSDPLSPVPVGSTTVAHFPSSATVAVSDYYLIVGRGPLLARLAKHGNVPAPVGDGDVAVRHPVPLQAVPNPFNPRVSLEFSMTTAGRAEVDVFDLRGRRVARLGGYFEEPGPVTVVWDGRNFGGQEMPSAVYLVQVITAEGSAARKIVLAR